MIFCCLCVFYDFLLFMYFLFCYWFVIFVWFVRFVCLSVYPFTQSLRLRSNHLLDGLGKVRAHVALEVEVRELIRRLQLEKGRKLLVGVNLASVLLVLEVVGADVLVNVTGDLGARHLGPGGLLEELGKLVADERGLDKARGGTVSGLALALGALLVGRLQLARPLLLEGTVLGLEGRNEGSELLELREELNRLVGEGSLTVGRSSDLDGGVGGSNNGGSSGGGSGLRLLLLHLLHGGSGSSGGGSSGDNGGLRGLLGGSLGSSVLGHVCIIVYLHK